MEHAYEGPLATELANFSFSQNLNRDKVFNRLDLSNVIGVNGIW